MERLWTPAAHGERLEDFHVALARHQHDADRRGLYLDRHGLNPGIGGELHIARVDRDGISVKVLKAFNGVSEISERCRKDGELPVV